MPRPPPYRHPVHGRLGLDWVGRGLQPRLNTYVGLAHLQSAYILHKVVGVLISGKPWKVIAAEGYSHASGHAEFSVAQNFEILKCVCRGR